MKAVTKAQLEALKKKELRKFAADHLGIILSMQKSHKDMVSTILLALPDGTTEVVMPVPTEQTQAYAQEKKIPHDPNSIPRNKVRLVIHKKHDSLKDRPLFLGHNGRSLVVMTGKEVDFPAECISSLVNAVEYRSVWDSDLETADLDGGWKLSPAYSYPFSIIGFGPGTEKAQMIVAKQSKELSEMLAA